MSGGYTRDIDPVAEACALFAAAIIRDAVQEYCQQAAADGRGPSWAYDHLCRDYVAAYWAESIGIDWPPDRDIIAAIVTALAHGETVWPSARSNP